MSGLLSGLLLQRAGWAVDIYERVETELSGRGAGIVAQQELIARLRKLGLETDGPNDTASRVWRHRDDELLSPELNVFGPCPHVRGLAAFGPHPLFAGLGQGTYLWAPVEGERDVRAAYARYVQIVPEVTQEPNYDEALDALRRAAG